MKALIMNKQVLLALGAIVFVGALVANGTGAFFTDQATASANVFQAGTLDLKIAENSSSNTPTGGWHNNRSATWNFADMAPGDTPVLASLWLKNVGTVDGMKLGIEGTNSITTGPNLAPQVRITKLTFGGSNLLTAGAGATIDNYQEPATCTVTATPGNLVSTLGSAAAGSIVCVEEGSYNPAGTLAVSTDSLTIVGLHDPEHGHAAKITGRINVTGDDVTIRGLNIVNPNNGYGVSVSGSAERLTVSDNIIHNIGTTLSQGSAQAISIENGATGGTGYTITGNRIYNVGSTNLTYGNPGSAKGIYLGDTNASGVLDAVTIENNIIHDIAASGNPWGHDVGVSGRGAYGVLTNVDAGVTNLVIKNNSIYDLDGLWSHAVGLEGLTTGAMVTYNDIYNLVNHKVSNDSTGVMVEDNTGTGIKVNYNNLPVAYGVIQASENSSHVAIGAPVNATHNWWGDFDPSDQVASNGPNINTSDYAGGPIAGLIGGTDYNSNGYADLQDLAQTPLTGATPGLDAGQYRRLIIGVQVDGPTTDDSFQGSNLSSGLIFTLSQV